MSIVFTWSPQEIENLLQSCKTDPVLPFIEKYYTKNHRLLESRSGAGRFVRFLTDAGYDITGLEISQETVDMVKQHWPDLKTDQGDCTASPYPDNSFDGIISLGVIEHWKEGPQAPLKDMYRILKPGGVAIITSPVLNGVRAWKHRWFLKEFYQFPKAFLRWMFRGKELNIFRWNKKYIYVVEPAVGHFFEYHMSKEQYRAEAEKTGFKVLDHVAIGEMDGIYHELNPFGWLVKFRDWKFFPTPLARWIHKKMGSDAFRYAHVQAIIVTK